MGFGTECPFSATPIPSGLDIFTIANPALIRHFRQISADFYIK
jgi:hypothetical protein